MHVIFRVRMHLTFRVCMHVTSELCMHVIFTEHYSPPSPKIACPEAMTTQIHNQSTEPTKSGDDPRVPNYPRRSIAPSAQNTALYGTITRDLLKASSSNH